MKTRANRGFSGKPCSFDFSDVPCNSSTTRQKQGRKLDGASGARCAPRARQVTTALLAPSVRDYRPALAFSIQPGRRGADDSVLNSKNRPRTAPADFPAKPCTGANHDVPAARIVAAARHQLQERGFDVRIGWIDCEAHGKHTAHLRHSRVAES